MIVDRRAEYYARAAATIAADPLAFYSRAELGRRIQVRAGQGAMPADLARRVEIAAEAKRKWKRQGMWVVETTPGSWDRLAAAWSQKP